MNQFENRSLAVDSVLGGISRFGDHIVSKGVF